MKKKLLILPLIVAFLIACMLPAIASEFDVQTNGVAITSGVGAPGQEVKMQVSLPETFADTVGIRFTVEGEGLVMSEASVWLTDGDISDVDVANGVGAWAVNEPKTLEGNVFEAVFKISENAQIGDEFKVNCQVNATWNGNAVREGKVTATVSVRNSAKLSGTVTSNGTATDTVTVELLNSESVVVATQELTDGDNTYEFTVDQGEYIVRVSKTKHCTREYAVSMASMEDTVQDVKILLYGDVNSDGRIRVNDISEIAKYLTKKASAITTDNPYIMSVADVNNDGRIRVNDISEISKYLTKKASAFDSMP